MVKIIQTQEIRFLCHITLDVPLEKTKEELMKMFNTGTIHIWGNKSVIPYISELDIVDIETEDELYNTEEK